jgi:hypothetical protein
MQIRFRLPITGLQEIKCKFVQFLFIKNFVQDPDSMKRDPIEFRNNPDPDL